MQLLLIISALYAIKGNTVISQMTNWPPMCTHTSKDTLEKLNEGFMRSDLVYHEKDTFTTYIPSK